MKKIRYSRLFILGVLIYLLFKGITILMGMNTKVLVLKNDLYSLKIKEKCLIIRNEYIVKSDVSGNVILPFGKNMRVKKGQDIAIIYNGIDNKIIGDIKKLKKEINDLEKENNIFNKGVLAVKKEQLRILEEKVRVNTIKYYAPTPGIISYSYDKNENKYNVDKLSNLTVEDIENTTNNYIDINKNNKCVKNGDVLARIIDNKHVYITFKQSGRKLFKKGENIKFKVKNKIIDGEIYEIYKKKDYYIIIAKIIQQNVEIYDTRQAEFDIIYKQIEGLKIPKESVAYENNKKGVYIINEENNKPKFEEIKGDYFEDEKNIYVNYNKNKIDGINSVNLHDRIILNPNFINKVLIKVN